MPLKDTPVQLPLFPADKRCRACGETKPLQEFYQAALSAPSTDGHRTRCKACWALGNAAYRAAHGEAIRVAAQLAYAADPEPYKKRSRAYRASHAQQCQARDRDYRRRMWSVLYPKKRAYVLAHPEKVEVWRRTYYQRNQPAIAERFKMYERRDGGLRKRVRVIRRRALAARACGTHTSEDVQLLYEAQGGRCAYCQSSLERGFQVDHMQALARGGSNGIENLALACSSCNNRKFTRDAGTWLAILIKESRAERKAQAAT